MNENSSGYEHYVPMVQEDATWQSKVQTHCVHSIEELKQIIEDNKDKKYVGFDTETTGLNYDVDRIVGFSIAFNNNEGYYVPIRHIVGKNLQPDVALDMLYNMLCSKAMVFVYNVRFDFRMMESEGYDMSKVKYYEVMTGVFCSDTNWKKTGLKLAERRWLGWTADTFTETVGDAENFSYTDPEDSSFYASVDSFGCFAVAEKTIKYYKEAGVAGRVLNEVQYPFMKCEETKIDIDKNYLNKCQIEVMETLKDYEHEIYQEVGYQFKINSNKQLGDALQSLGINTNAYTKGGQMKVDIPTLELVNRELKSSLINKLIEYSQLFKQYNSYILSLIKQGESNDWKLRFHYYINSAPTGRIAAGQDRKNSYFANLNIMAIPKPHSKMYYVHDYHEGDELKEGDFVILDWRFSLQDKSEWMSEGMDQHLNMRSAFLPKKGHYIVACDYSAQELVMQANLANAKLWVNTFNSGGDLHRVMAESIWGKENYNKDYRKKAKACFDENALFSCREGAIRGYNLDTTKHHLLDLNGNDQEYNFFREWRLGYRVELSNGQIVNVTEGHKFRVYDEFIPRDVPVEELTVGRQLGVHGLRSYGDYKTFTLEKDRLHSELKLVFDEDIAYVCGMILGDGSIIHDKEVKDGVCVVAQSDNKEEVKEILIRIGNPREYVTSDSWCRIDMQSRRFAKWFYDNFGMTVTKHIGDIVFESPRSVMLSFLAGLLDTDGRVNKNNITYLGVNEKLLRQVADLVALLGFSSKWIVEKGIFRNKLVTCYGVNIYYEESVKEIPLRLGYKRDFILNRKKSDISWSILNEERYKFEEYKPCKYQSWYDNFMTGKSKRFSKKTAIICGDIRKDYSPVKIVSIEQIPVNAICLECSTHEFSASALDGPNCNFGLLYGMSAYTMKDRIDESLEDTKKIIDKYWKSCPEIPAFQNAMLRRAKKEGTVYTYFGLPRRVKYYLESSDPKKRAFGVRTVQNTVIQGGCSTITLLGLLKAYKELYSNPEWKDDCSFFSYIHDEIVSSVKKERAEDFAKIMMKCMYKDFKGLPVPFRTSCSIGVSWGCQIEFKINEEGRLVPDMERVKE